jgi:hypothetical protein
MPPPSERGGSEATRRRRTATVLVAVGTRLALSWRPGAPLLAAPIVAALAVAAGWCAVAVRTHSPAARPR